MTLMPRAISSPASPALTSAPDPSMTRTSMPRAGRPHEVSLRPTCSSLRRAVRKPVSLQPVALPKSDAGQAWGGAADKLGGHRRAAVGDLIEARQIVLSELRE